MSLRTWSWAAIACLLAGCTEDNSPPSLGLILDQQVTVGENLRVILTAVDPDGDTITFGATGLPDGALVTQRSRTEAVLSYSPVVTDTQPGGRRYEVEVTAEDGSGGVARQRFGLNVFRAFGIPSFDVPAGLVLNMAQDQDLSILVEVKDDDSTDVDIAMDEGPEGAKLQRAGAKSAVFYWRPTDEQRQRAVHRAIFTAADESHPQISHVLTIVLMNAEKQSGCVGTPPTILHTPAGDREIDGTWDVEGVIDDADSIVQSAVLHWTRGDPLGAYTAAIMTRVSDDANDWRSLVDMPAAPAGGALVHYYITATDNDDPRGIACDQTARLPKKGFLTAALYPSGALPGACVDDGAEPDGATSSAPKLKAGIYPGRRICGTDTDLAEVDAPPGTTISAQVSASPSAAGLTLALVDASGAELAAGSVTGAGELGVSYDVLADESVYARVVGGTASTAASYTLRISVDEVECDDDSMEPNSAPGDAKAVGQGVFPDLRVCPGDSDFFSVAVTQGQPVTITAAFDHRYGDLDMELRAADGVTVLATSQSERSIEEIAWSAPQTETVIVRVYGVDGARNDYTLTVGSGPTPGGCSDDPLTGNHSADDAVGLFTGLFEGFFVCEGAEDWLVVNVNGGENYELLVEPVGSGTVTIELYEDPRGGSVATGTADGGLVFVDHRRTTEGPIYARIQASGAAEVGYTMLQAITDPAGPCQPDRFEPSSSIGDATPINPGVHTWLRLCGDDDTDAFAVEAPALSTLTIFTGHDVDIGYGDVEVYDPDGALLEEAFDFSNGASLEAFADEEGTYTILVKPFDVGDGIGYDFAVFVD